MTNKKFVVLRLNFPESTYATIEYKDTFAKQLPNGPTGSGTRAVSSESRNKVVTASAAGFTLTTALYSATNQKIDNDSAFYNLYFIQNKIEQYSDIPFCVVQFLKSPTKFHADNTHYTFEITVSKVAAPVKYVGSIECHFRVLFAFFHFCLFSKKRSKITDEPLQIVNNKRGLVETKTTLINKKPFVLPASNKPKLTLKPNSGSEGTGIQCIVENWKIIENVYVNWHNKSYHGTVFNEGIFVKAPPGKEGETVPVVVMGENEQLSNIALFVYEKSSEISGKVTVIK